MARNVRLSFPKFGFIVSTRAALGVGIGLLISEYFPITRRRAVGAALVAIGATTTVPALAFVLRPGEPLRRLTEVKAMG